MIQITPAEAYIKRALSFLKRHHEVCLSVLTYEETGQMWRLTAQFRDIAIIFVYDKIGRSVRTFKYNTEYKQVEKDAYVMKYSLDTEVIRYRHVANMTIQQARQ